MEPPEFRSQAWPVLQQLVPVAIRLYEVLSDDPAPEELPAMLDGLLGARAFARPEQWAAAAEVLEEIAEFLEEDVVICDLPPAGGPCERRRRRRPRGRG